MANAYHGVSLIMEFHESRSILRPLLFLIYINDLIENPQSNLKLFSDDISLFTMINDSNAIASQLSEDLNK